MKNTKLSKLAEGLTSLSISKISEIVNEKIKHGGKIFNLTIGDFSSRYFPIPAGLENEIVMAYHEKYTDYPMVGGMEELRIAIAEHVKLRGGFDYSPDEIVVASGTRPLIYLLFKALVDPGEKVINVVPSWNNYNFIYLAGATAIVIKAKPENNFLITAAELRSHIKEAVLITLGSPLNPSGTVFNQEILEETINLIVAENIEREKYGQKPLYVLFDMIYWLLIYNETKHYNPVVLNPKIRDYIVFVDGISKCFAATGVRVGWALGPKPIIDKMRSMLAHVGAWAPKPEQIGTTRYLKKYDEVDIFLADFKNAILARLNIFYEDIQELKNAGYKVDAKMPQGAIYLAVKLDLIGAKTKSNKILSTVEDIAAYLLENAKVALVPFYVFGADTDCPWFRISVGKCSIDDAKVATKSIRQSIEELRF